MEQTKKILNNKNLKIELLKIILENKFLKQENQELKLEIIKNKAELGYLTGFIDGLLRS